MSVDIHLRTNLSDSVKMILKPVQENIIHFYLPTIKPVCPLAGSYGHLPFPSSMATVLRVKMSEFCRHTRIHTHTISNTGGLLVTMYYDPRGRAASSVCPLQGPHLHLRHVVPSRQCHTYAHTRKLSHIRLTLREILIFHCIYFYFVTQWS